MNKTLHIYTVGGLEVVPGSGMESRLESRLESGLQRKVEIELESGLS